jgi:UDP-glucose 4-epimerase
MFDRVYDLPTLSLRFFNVYGARQPKTGPYGLVIGIFLDAAKSGQSLEIHGSGDQRRDFVNVADVADCIKLALFSARRGKTFNVGSGANVSVLELAQMISNNHVFSARRSGDAQETLADIASTVSELGWTPKISLEEGLDELKGN